MPAIAATNDVPATDAQWSLTITLLSGAVATPMLGRLDDGPHRHRVIVGVLTLVGIGSVLTALPLGVQAAFWLGAALSALPPAGGGRPHQGTGSPVRRERERVGLDDVGTGGRRCGSARPPNGRP